MAQIIRMFEQPLAHSEHHLSPFSVRLESIVSRVGAPPAYAHGLPL